MDRSSRSCDILPNCRRQRISRFRVQPRQGPKKSDNVKGDPDGPATQRSCRQSRWPFCSTRYVSACRLVMYFGLLYGRPVDTYIDMAVTTVTTVVAPGRGRGRKGLPARRSVKLEGATDTDTQGRSEQEKKGKCDAVDDGAAHFPFSHQQRPSYLLSLLFCPSILFPTAGCYSTLSLFWLLLPCAPLPFSHQSLNNQ